MYLNQIKYASIAMTIRVCQGRGHWWDLANKATKHIQIKKHRNTDVHVLLHRCEIWHLVLGEEMYKDTHEQGAGENTWIQEAETDRRISKTV